MSQPNQLAAIARLLGQLWLREIRLPALAAMNGSKFKATYLELGGYIPESFDEATVEDLAAEYCALLIGPKGHVSPVQSVWNTNQFQSESSGSMNRFFELLPGYQPESNLSDHLGVQLDFLGALLERSDQATVQEIVEHFTKTHLQWAPQFLAYVKTQSKSEFYRGLANVTDGLIESVRTVGTESQ